jgi:F-type H+-transporting ATPase subunit b
VLAANNFLVPSVPTFIFELVAFLIVLGVIAKYVLPPLTTAMNARQETIQKALADAETATRRAQQAEDDYRKTIEVARNEARSVLDEAKRLGEQVRTDLRERGEAEYQRIVTRAQSDIDASVRQAREQVRQQTAELVIAVVERVVGEVLDAESQRRLIDRTIADVESQASAPALAGGSAAGGEVRS